MLKSRKLISVENFNRGNYLSKNTIFFVNLSHFHYFHTGIRALYRAWHLQFIMKTTQKSHFSARPQTKPERTDEPSHWHRSHYLKSSWFHGIVLYLHVCSHCEYFLLWCCWLNSHLIQRVVPGSPNLINYLSERVQYGTVQYSMSIVGVETSIVNGIHTIRHEVKRIEVSTVQWSIPYILFSLTTTQYALTF